VAVLAMAALAAGGTAAFADGGPGGNGGAEHGQQGQSGQPGAKGEDHGAKVEDRGAKGDDPAGHDDKAGDDRGQATDDHRGRGHDGQRRAGVEVYTLDGDHGNPEGVAFDKRSRTFFVSSAGDGSIWRGRLGDTATPVPVFIPGAQGSSATGMKIFGVRLYVAGASTGTIKVYDVDSGRLLAMFDTKGASTAPTFVNDLVVTRRGDVYATDSFRPAIYRLSAAEIAAGTPAGAPIAAGDTISTAPEIPFDATPGTFNLNGIAALGGDRGRRGDRLVVVDSNSGRLFGIGVDPAAPASRRITELVVDGGPFKGGDGLLVDRGRLLVVQGQTAAFPHGVVSFVKLRRGGSAGRLEDQRTDDHLRGPSTIARARDEYLVVNADFATSTKPFTVVGLPREHRGH
jgi:sugar lactone lactonase YvrE